MPSPCRQVTRAPRQPSPGTPQITIPEHHQAGGPTLSSVLGTGSSHSPVCSLSPCGLFPASSNVADTMTAGRLSLQRPILVTQQDGRV